ncbi:MAG: minor capsid protein [Candidatus Paceibacterota bacterium]
MIEDIANYMAEQMSLTVGENIFASHLPSSPNTAIAVLDGGGPGSGVQTGIKNQNIHIMVRDLTFEAGNTICDTIRSLLNAKQVPIMAAEKVDVVTNANNSKTRAYLNSVSGYDVGDWIKLVQGATISYRQLSAVNGTSLYLEWVASLAANVNSDTDITKFIYSFMLSTALPAYIGREENGIHSWSNNYMITVKQ